MKGLWKDTPKQKAKNKPWWKPPGWWKKFRRKLNRHRLNQLVREGKDLPSQKKNNIWDWL